MDLEKFTYKRKHPAFTQLSESENMAKLSLPTSTEFLEDDSTAKKIINNREEDERRNIVNEPNLGRSLLQLAKILPSNGISSSCVGDLVNAVHTVCGQQEKHSYNGKKRKRCYIHGSDDDNDDDDNEDDSDSERSRKSSRTDTQDGKEGPASDTMNNLEKDSQVKKNGNQDLSSSLQGDEDGDCDLLISDQTGVRKPEDKLNKNSCEVICISDSDDDVLESDNLVSETLHNNNAGDESDDEDLREDEMVTILSFFNDCSLQELASVPGLSDKKAQKIVKMRPFICWDDLVTKLDSAQSLSSKLIENCQSLLEERNVVENLMNKCEKIANKIQDMLILRLTADKNGFNSAGNRDFIRFQPTILNKSLQLKPYQLTSLNWLALMHEQNVNGILADEMGLGKTVQAIAFLAHLSESGENGPHLIIVPASTLDNWAREFKKWCPSLECVLYYGSQVERTYLREEIRGRSPQPDVILTTYSIATGTYDDRSFLRKRKSHYVILDEGHMLKNMQSQRYQSLMRMNARRRLLLTGTPLQNNLLELMSLLSFVMPEMFGESVQGIKLLFSNKRTNNKPCSSYENSTVAQARRIMRPFVLRRLKKDVLQQLPVKHDHLSYCDLTQDQRHLYNETFLNCSKQFRQSGLYSQYNNILMTLRKAANHPLLLRNHYSDNRLLAMAQEYCKDSDHRDSESDLVFEDMTVMSDFELHRLCSEERRLGDYCLPREMLVKSGKFEFLDSLLPQLKQEERRVLLFSQFTMMMDIIEVYLSDRRHRYLRLDGQTSVVERQSLIDKYSADPDIFVFLLSTKAGGLGINLTAANVVILHDIDFNPYNDKQAEDRSHRVGQTRDVDVYRLISKNTIDEAILRCAKLKLQLEQDMATSDKDDETSPKDVLEILNQAFNS